MNFSHFIHVALSFFFVKMTLYEKEMAVSLSVVKGEMKNTHAAQYKTWEPDLKSLPFSEAFLPALHWNPMLQVAAFLTGFMSPSVV